MNKNQLYTSKVDKEQIQGFKKKLFRVFVAEKSTLVSAVVLGFFF